MSQPQPVTSSAGSSLSCSRPIGLEERSRTESSPGEEPSPRRRRASARHDILLVEDDRGVRGAVAEILEEEGHSVTLAENGRQALDKLHSAPSPDLIILDLRMPVMDGWAFRAAQKTHPDLARIPVLAVSAERSAKAAAIDAEAYLSKPLEREALLGVISRITSASALPRADRESETFSLNGLVEVALALARDRLERRTRIRKLYGELHPVVGDSQALCRFLHTSIIDITDALPEEDVDSNLVAVRTYMKGSAAYLEIGSACVGESSVRNAVRFPDDVQETDSALGAVDAYRGRIEVDSQPDGGAVLRVILPLARCTTTEATPSNVETPVGGRSPARLLIIDDVPMLGQALARGLREHEVTTVSRAEEAFRLLAEEKAFDVILCDVMMPRLGGREVLERLKADWPQLVPRLIFMTGGASGPGGRAFLNGISQQVLLKPFSLDELRGAIHVLRDRLGDS